VNLKFFQEQDKHDQGVNLTKKGVNLKKFPKTRQAWPGCEFNQKRCELKIFQEQDKHNQGVNLTKKSVN